METLYLIAGLGNPGPEYSRTRHNAGFNGFTGQFSIGHAGFMAVEALAGDCRAAWKNEPKFRSRIARGAIAGRMVIFCEPQTFMNASGEALAPLAAYYKIARENILVAVDDADLPLGQIRLRPEGSSGGHHGLESIERHFGSRGFARLRIGIGRTGRQLREITGHVLGAFSADEKPLLEQVLERSARQIKCYLTEGMQKAMSQYNGAVAPENKEQK